MSSKNRLLIRTTEPIVVLRSPSEYTRGRRRAAVDERAAIPAILRGLLTVKLGKATRISRIDVVLEGVVRTDWPEGIGPRRMDVSEENTFLSTQVTLFKAQQKRPRTVGPGVAIHEESRRGSPDDEQNSSSSNDFTRGRQSNYARIGQTSMRPNTAAPGTSPSMNPRTNRSSHSDAFNALNNSHSLGPTSRPELEPQRRPSTAGPSSSRSIPFISTPKHSQRPTTAQTIDSQSEKKTRRKSGLMSWSSKLYDVKEKVQGHSQRQLGSSFTSEQAPPTTQRPSTSSGKRPVSRGGRLARLVGIDASDEESHNSEGLGWKEFRTGTYNYPISFTIPSNLPPSLACDYGSVQYKLKAYVHRPGPFSTKLSASTAVEVIHAPLEEDTEEGDALIIERQWDFQLRYLITFDGHHFPQGGDMSWSVHLMPLAKMKLHRLTFMLEERIDYTARNLTRSDPVRRFQLLALRHPMSNSKSNAHLAPPILPAISNDGARVVEDILLRFADPPESTAMTEEERKSYSLAHLLSPDGPWHLHGTLKVPQTWLHVSCKHPNAGICIKHSLKIFIRVERGDDDAIDLRTGRRKQFDIIIETPIHILSRYCQPDLANLPRYDEVNILPSFPPEPASPNFMVASMQHDGRNEGAPHSPVGLSTTSSRPTTPATTPPMLNVATNRVEVNEQFARLVAGFEDEEGELPPPYSSNIPIMLPPVPELPRPNLPPRSRLRQGPSTLARPSTAVPSGSGSSLMHTNPQPNPIDSYKKALTPQRTTYDVTARPSTSRHNSYGRFTNDQVTGQSSIVGTLTNEYHSPGRSPTTSLSTTGRSLSDQQRSPSTSTDSQHSPQSDYPTRISSKQPSHSISGNYLTGHKPTFSLSMRPSTSHQNNISLPNISENAHRKTRRKSAQIFG